MKVKELIEILSKVDPELTVYITAEAGCVGEEPTKKDIEVIGTQLTINI